MQKDPSLPPGHAQHLPLNWTHPAVHTMLETPGPGAIWLLSDFLNPRHHHSVKCYQPDLLGGKNVKKNEIPYSKMTSNDRQMGEEGKHCSKQNHKALNLYLSASATGFQFFGSQTSSTLWISHRALYALIINHVIKARWLHRPAADDLPQLRDHQQFTDQSLTAAQILLQSTVTRISSQ